MKGEDFSLHDVEKAELGEDFKLALSRASDGANVFIVGPAGSGKTLMLRKLGLYLSRAGRRGVYVKLEWVKYGWGLSDYVSRYGARSRELTGLDGGVDADLILLDDGELVWGYGSAYKNLLRDLRGRQIVAAFREIDVDAAALLFGDGFVIYLKGEPAEAPMAKSPFGFAFLNKSAEIIVI